MKKTVPQYEVKVEPCRKAGLETVKLTKGDKSVYLHSRYDPVSEAEKLTANLKILEDSVYFIFGLGLGSHVRALAARMGKENKIIVFEPNEKIYRIFMSNEKNNDIINDDRIIIARYESVYQVRSVLAPFYLYMVSYTKNAFFALPVYKDIYKNEYDDFVLCIMNCTLSCILVKRTDKKQSDIRFKCLVNNIDFLCQSYSGSKLMGMYRGIPAIIVSAGPSLSKNVDLLKEAPGKVVIISVDTAFQTLYNKGIMPDYVISVDPQPIVAKKFKGPDISKAILITSYQSSTEVQRIHEGKKIAVREFHLFLDECFDDLGIDLPFIEVGGSVACSAIDLAYKMGADPIILLGQDLAFTDNKSHVAGSAFYFEIVPSMTKLLAETIMVEDINGGLVPTAHNLNAYREWIQMYIAEHGDREYIDATEGGAAIDGTVITTFRDTIGKYFSRTYDISERKESIFVPENRSVSKEQFEGFIEHFEKSCKYLKRIVPEVDVCIGLIEKMIKEINYNGLSRPDRISAPYKKIQALDKSLDINEHYVDIILSLMAAEREEATTTEHLLNAAPEQALAGDLQKYLRYYKALSEKIKYAVPFIEKAVLRGKESLEALNNE